MRFGVRLPLAAGLLLAAIGLALFARVPVDGHYVAVAGIAGGLLLRTRTPDKEPGEPALAAS